MDGLMILFLGVGASGGLLLGLLLGWFIGRNEGQKRAEAKAARLQAVAPSDEKTAADEAGAPPAPPPPSLGLLLRRRAGELQVTLDGVTYRRYATMPADSRNRLLGYLKLVRIWMEDQPTQDVRVAATPAPAATAPPVAEADASASADQKDMVARIDEIVQRLAARAGMTTPVRIVRGLQGGVNIIVGTQRYASVADIPDEQIQALVRQAARMWEKEH